MKGKSIETRFQEKGLAEVEVDQLLTDLAEINVYKNDYLKWSPTAITALLNYIQTRLNISESLDAMLFNILESCLKAYPADSIILQKEIVEAMKGFAYPEYYMSKCMSLIEIGAAIYHWEEALVIDLGTAIIKNTKKQNKNIDDEYGGTYYEVLKSLEPLADNPKVTKAVRSYYVLDDRDKKKHPYKDETTVIKNTFSVYVSTRQYDRAIAFFQEKIEQIPEKDIHKRYYMYLSFAKAYYNLGDYDKARATAKIAQEIRPKQDSAYYFVATLYQEEGNKAACLAEYEWAYKQVGCKNYILEDQLKKMNEYGYFSEGLKIANDLIEKDYRVIDVTFYKGEALEGLKDYAAAIAAYESYGENAPNNRKHWKRLFTCHNALGNKEKALEIGHKILQEETRITEEEKEQIKALVDQLK